jgi:hypothetical protein
VEPELAELVDLKFFCGFTFSEIAALRNLSERTVIRKLGKASISIAALAPICRSEELMSKLSPDQWQALSPRLDEPLELGDDERSAWFATLRAEDPTLARQLEMLLQEHRELSEEGFLGERPVALTGAPGLAGRIFSVYTLVSQIGHGGMGTVWLAQRNDGRFERRVAAKVLNFALMGKGGEERFKREGRILGRLKYPHIAELIDADVSPSGQPFLVLEHIEGGHIDLYCDSTQARRPSARPAVPRCLGGRGACTCQPDRPPLKLLGANGWSGEASRLWNCQVAQRWWAIRGATPDARGVLLYDSCTGADGHTRRRVRWQRLALLRAGY